MTNYPAEADLARRRAVLLWLAVGVVFVVRLAALREFVIDDAFISFRYARNLGDGQGLVFNAGELVEGYSNVAWVLAMAPCIRAGLDPMLAARALSILCAVLTFVLLVRLSAALDRGVDAQGALAPLALAFNSSFVLWTLAGLETQLMAACVTALLYAAWSERGRGAPAKTMALAALLVFVRPEGAAYSVGAALMLFAAPRLVGGRRSWRWMLPLIVGAGAFGLHCGWRAWYYGSPLPNIFYAKSGGTLFHIEEGLSYCYSFVSAYGHVSLIALVMVTWLARRDARPLLVGACSLVGVGAAFAAYAGGDWMPGWRFLVPVMPLTYWLLQEGVRDVVGSLERTLGERPAHGVGLAGWALLLFAHCTQFPAAERVAHSFGVEHALARAAGEQLARRARPGAVIAVADAGAIPYFSRLRTIDRRGLMDAHIARLGRSDFMWKCDEPYVLAQSPDYIESQLPIELRLPRVDKAAAAASGFPPELRAHLRRLPPGATLAAFAQQYRWPGDGQLYASAAFLSRYRPLWVYKVPGLWHVVVSERRQEGHLGRGGANSKEFAP